MRVAQAEPGQVHVDRSTACVVNGEVESVGETPAVLHVELAAEQHDQRRADVDGPGEVRVRVRLSGVNPTDVKTRDASTPRPIDGFTVPHQDGVGEIDAVGDRVDGDRLGQRVWLYLATAEPGAGAGAAQRWGAAAQWCVVPAEQAVPVPADVSDQLAAALGVPALTAYHCLFGDGPLDGRAVLVAGGALTALPVRHFGLDDIAAAHEAVESGDGGKVVLDLG